MAELKFLPLYFKHVQSWYKRFSNNVTVIWRIKNKHFMEEKSQYTEGLKTTKYPCSNYPKAFFADFGNYTSYLEIPSDSFSSLG